MTIVLGMSISHYGSACIVADGEIKAAVLEERLSRKKFDAGFPALSIRKVMEIAGVSPHEIDQVAVGTMCESFDSNLAQDHEYRVATRLLSVASSFIPIEILEAGWLRWVYRTIFSTVNQRLFFQRSRDFFRELGISRDKIVFYDHHTCHAATAYFGSPWRDETLVFTADGNGDGYCATVGIGSGEKIDTKIAISSIHSLGGLYSRATRFMGMKPWQDEYKVMGMAPWGARKKKADEVYRKFSRMWAARGLEFRNLCGYACNSLLAHMNRTLNNPRFDYVAHAVQRVLEDIVSTWIGNNMKHFGLRRIACSGGIFYNIKANKRVIDDANPQEMFIFPTAGDESTSIGAAYIAWTSIQKAKGLPAEIKPITDVYWGEDITALIEATIATLDRDRYEISHEKDIESTVAGLLARNEIVALCHGRMECCPRALGNRSILANPSDIRNIERLNDTIKQRDFWMPFALTVLKEREQDYLVNPNHLPSHYMIMGFDTKPERRNEIVAGIHQADKTVRPQILERSFNPRYHRIIELFDEQTGIGGLLNTSLNMHGDPMVNLPSEAIEVMEQSSLRYLALGDYLVTKKGEDCQEDSHDSR